MEHIGCLRDDVNGAYHIGNGAASFFILNFMALIMSLFEVAMCTREEERANERARERERERERERKRDSKGL